MDIPEEKETPAKLLQEAGDILANAHNNTASFAAYALAARHDGISPADNKADKSDINTLNQAIGALNNQDASAVRKAIEAVQINN
jgi:hypothetical protein